MGQYLPVDLEVGGLNLGDGKSLFFWTTTENEMETKLAEKTGMKIGPILVNSH